MKGQMVEQLENLTWLGVMQGEWRDRHCSELDVPKVLELVKSGHIAAERRTEWYVHREDLLHQMSAELRGRRKPKPLLGVRAKPPLPDPDEDEEAWIEAMWATLSGDTRVGIETPPPMVDAAWRRALARAETKGRHCMTLQECYGLWHRSGGCCELTGVPFVLGQGRNPNSLSIDRIDSQLGYEQHNSRLVTFQVNMALNSWGTAAFDRMSRARVAQLDANNKGSNDD